MPASFAVVNFTQTNEIEVVPLSWINKNGCVWPPYKPSDVQKMIKKVSKPSEDWIRHEVRILGQYATYDMARRNLKKAEDFSDLTSDPENYGKGKRKLIPRKFSSSSTSDSDELTFTDSTGIVVPTLNEDILSNLTNATLQDVNVQVEDVHQTKLVNEVVTAVPTKESESAMNGTAIRALMREILIVKENQKLIIENQEIILNKLCASSTIVRGNSSVIAEDVLPVHLPISTMEDVRVIENALQDAAVFEYLVNLVSNCGGTTVDATVKRIMKKLFSDCVAQNYSWLGAKGKEIFSNLRLSEIIFASTRKNGQIHSCATDAEIEYAIKNWLRHAKARFVASESKQNASQSLIGQY